MQEKFKQLCADLKKLKIETDQEEIINIFKGIELLIVSTTNYYKQRLSCNRFAIQYDLFYCRVTRVDSFLPNLGISHGQSPLIELQCAR